MDLLPVLHRSIFASLLLAGSATYAAPEISWPVAPRHIELPTPYGTLAVGESEYIYESKLRLNGDLIEPQISGMLNISYAFSLPNTQAALVSISKGNNACPVSYRWVILKPDSYQVSPEFGSCSEQIRVSADSRKLTLQTPSQDQPGQVDVYEYDGKNIKHRVSK